MTQVVHMQQEALTTVLFLMPQQGDWLKLELCNTIVLIKNPNRTVGNVIYSVVPKFYKILKLYFFRL